MKKDSLVNSMRLHLMLADRRPLITNKKSEFEVGFEINISTILYVHKVIELIQEQIFSENCFCYNCIPIPNMPWQTRLRVVAKALSNSFYISILYIH